jgi:hypothetical protein
MDSAIDIEDAANPTLADRLFGFFADERPDAVFVTGSGPQDAFEVALIDPATMTALTGVVGLSGTDALLNIQADGTVLAAASVQISGLVDGKLPGSLSAPVTVTIDLSSLPAGQNAALYFDLLGFGSLGSQVSIDDVVLDGNQAPALAAVDPVSAVEGQAITVQLVGSDPEGDTLTYVLDTAPAGATVDAQGVIHWTAVDGSDAVVFTAHAVDSHGAASSTRSFTVIVGNVAPTFTVEVPATIRAGEAFSITLSASDPGTDTITQWAIDWGDGTQSTLAGSASGASHTYADRTSVV